MIRVSLKVLIIIIFCTRSEALRADSFLDWATGYRTTAWANCDFRIAHGRLDARQYYHIGMLGDSNGALFGAEPAMGPPESVWWQNSKRWEKFLSPGPSNGGEWKVLNMAISGQTASELKKRLEQCLVAENSDTLRDSYLQSTPDRVWLQIGGNDMLHAALLETPLLPYIAHYRVNAVLNNVAKIITLHQKNGRTVLLVGTFPFKAQWVRDNWLGKQTPDPHKGCFEELPDAMNLPDAGELVNFAKTQITPLPFDDAAALFGQWGMVNPFSMENIKCLNPENLIGGILETLRKNLVKLERWLFADSSLISQADRELGRVTGSGCSLSGREYGTCKYEGKIFGKLIPSTNPLVRAFAGFSILDALFGLGSKKPRPLGIAGPEGLAVIASLPNLTKAAASMVHFAGKRLRENKDKQGWVRVSEHRYSVDHIDIADKFEDPSVAFGGYNYLYANDAVHLNDSGFAIYGKALAETFNNLGYGDQPYTDGEMVKGIIPEWEPLPENPSQGYDDNDLLIIIACFFWC